MFEKKINNCFFVPSCEEASFTKCRWFASFFFNGTKLGDKPLKIDLNVMDLFVEGSEEVKHACHILSRCSKSSGPPNPLVDYCTSIHHLRPPNFETSPSGVQNEQLGSVWVN